MSPHIEGGWDGGKKLRERRGLVMCALDVELAANRADTGNRSSNYSRREGSWEQGHLRIVWRPYPGQSTIASGCEDAAEPVYMRRAPEPVIWAEHPLRRGTSEQTSLKVVLHPHFLDTNRRAFYRRVSLTTSRS